MKKIIALIVACLLAVSVFAGCGGSSNSTETSAPATEAADAADANADADAADADADNSAIIGSWVNTALVDPEGNAYTTAEFAEANGVEVDAVMATYTFTEDGKVTQQTADTAMEGTYTFDGTNAELTFESGTLSFEFDAEKDALYNTDPNNGYTSQFDRIPEDEE